ncbi:hypothetical protein T10_1975 [Trichinella papuae]|uniref:Uncharacterized protein n=1 Tax=Trichinella papuae TaxID=268474 RepID=A0A0V1N6L1_9BILA|nr:hypothetical protein T10_1975 [Trichinella papuae]
MPKMRLPDPSKNYGEGWFPNKNNWTDWIGLEEATAETVILEKIYEKLRGALSGTVPRVCQARYAEVWSSDMSREETMSKVRMCEPRTEEPSRWSRNRKFEGVCFFIGTTFFSRPPVPDYRNQDLCDAFGLKGPPLVTAAQRKSVDV